MSLTKPIPKAMRERMEQDPFYHLCCITGVRRGYGTVIQWHHNFETYMHGNKGRLNAEWCILPISKAVHDKANTSAMRERLDWVMLNRASEAVLRHYSKAVDLVRKRDMLNEKFGRYKPKL